MKVSSKLPCTLAALALAAFAGDVLAQGAPLAPVGTAPAAPATPATAAAPPTRNVGYLIRMDFAFGGDELERVTWDNGDETKLKAGQLMTFAGGLIYRPDAPWALESTIGYKFDQANGSNGTIKFTRIPVDVVISYANSGHRLGVGATAHLSPKYSCEVDGYCDASASYDTALGAIAQYAYGFRLGVNGGLDVGVRYTRVQYSATGLPNLDGSNFGFFFGGWF